MEQPEIVILPKRQMQLRNLLERMAKAGHAQILIVTHSPILLSCIRAEIFSVDVALFKQFNMSEPTIIKYIVIFS
ncbi:MAG: hypothetical protein ONB31_05270 [candidate division KSB1 bacterium]|nr:hypothetical protein [candidate division KSB1 bacterium]MDZ7335506.1 hypothetical protein [candidate division KSB1 bacterium]MDZ7357113.1 hypothetical protein [candidate division KSB1 bacterium]MDZ7401763.1 hypothetical protein [candidate division KSB1 bacterium]